MSHEVKSNGRDTGLVVGSFIGRWPHSTSSRRWLWAGVLTGPAPSCSMKDVLFTSIYVCTDWLNKEMLSEQYSEGPERPLCAFKYKYLPILNILEFVFIPCSARSHEKGPSLFPMWKALQVTQSSYHSTVAWGLAAQVALCLFATKTCWGNWISCLRGLPKAAKAHRQSDSLRFFNICVRTVKDVCLLISACILDRNISEAVWLASWLDAPGIITPRRSRFKPNGSWWNSNTCPTFCRFKW